VSKAKSKTPISVIFGAEPKMPVDVTPETYQSELGSMLQWYGQYAGVSDERTRTVYHKEWLKEWALANGFKKKDINIPNSGISSKAALARIANKGFPLIDIHNQALKDSFVLWNSAVPAPVKKVDPSIRAAILKVHKAQEAAEIFGKIDHIVDGFIVDDYNFKSASEELRICFQSIKFSVEFSKELILEYSRELEMLKSDLKTKDLECYTFNITKMKKLIKLYEEILTSVDDKLMQTKVIRTRKASKKPASSMVKKLQYQPVFQDYNLVSIDVEKLVGCTTAFVFDTKKRLLKRFTSTSADGIKVAGTSLKDCLGKQKTIRKPKEQLQGFPKLTEIKADILFNDIVAKDKDCSGRMNMNTIVLKVY
jgi:hypothetical protein